MKIESVSGQPDRAGRYKVSFEQGKTMLLYRQTVEDFGLYAGVELSADQMDALRAAAGKMSAKMRAVRIVASSGVSKIDLEQRLIHKGESAKDAKEAVDWMTDMHLIDDAATAEQIVQRCITKGYGIARAKQALFDKRIPKEYWDDVLADYPDQEEAITQYLEAHRQNLSEPKGMKRTIDALIRKGHSYHNIRRTLERMSLSADDLLED